jgi:transposase
LRRAFGELIQSTLAPLVNHLKFIDEIGANMGLTRLYGRAAPGVRVVEATPGRSGTHYTLVATLGWQGIEAPWLLAGSMDRLAFETYVEFVLAPSLVAGDIVLLDNLSAHQSPRVEQLIEARGARVQFLSPYSPDFNPIELCWSKVKTALRAAKARTHQALIDALDHAFQSISFSDARAWFAHCGYVLS